MTSPSPGRPDSELLDANRHFYNALWTEKNCARGGSGTLGTITALP